MIKLKQFSLGPSLFLHQGLWLPSYATAAAFIDVSILNSWFNCFTNHIGGSGEIRGNVAHIKTCCLVNRSRTVCVPRAQLTGFTLQEQMKQEMNPIM